MGLIKKVLANVAQTLTDDEKRQAHQNIAEQIQLDYSTNAASNIRLKELYLY